MQQTYTDPVKLENFFRSVGPVTSQVKNGRPKKQMEHGKRK
jgi:hypothetical protein